MPVVGTRIRCATPEGCTVLFFNERFPCKIGNPIDNFTRIQFRLNRGTWMAGEVFAFLIVLYLNLPAM